MGSHNFFSKASSGGGSFKPSSVNLTARAGGAGGYASRAAGGVATKNIGAAQAMSKYMKLKPGVRSSAYGPGPKHK